MRWMLQYRANKCVFNSLWKLSLLTLGSLKLSGNEIQADEIQADEPATEKACRPYVCNRYQMCYRHLTNVNCIRTLSHAVELTIIYIHRMLGCGGCESCPWYEQITKAAAGWELCSYNWQHQHLTGAPNSNTAVALAAMDSDLFRPKHVNNVLPKWSVSSDTQNCRSLPATHTKWQIHSVLSLTNMAVMYNIVVTELRQHFIMQLLSCFHHHHHHRRQRSVASTQSRCVHSARMPKGVPSAIWFSCSRMKITFYYRVNAVYPCYGSSRSHCFSIRVYVLSWDHALYYVTVIKFKKYPLPTINHNI